MRSTIVLTAAMLATTPALAMTHSYSSPAFAGRAAAVDPDERLSRLAEANSPHDRSQAKPTRSARSILKDDPNLRAAFASLDNK